LPGGAAARVTLDLPGTSGFPAFSVDGKWLYFTQFLNDTNLDGLIDGRDNGVLFRARFSDGKLGTPEQLTSARLSCQYPVPAKDRLIATCQEHEALHVYTLPLAGGVPDGWSKQKIDAELSASRDRWEQLLLLAHEPRTPQVLQEMVRLHLQLGEYASAGFYAAALTGSDPVAGEVLRELAAERAEERALSRGLLSATFVRDARARLRRLAAVQSPLSALAQSEIRDTLGDEDAARALLEHVDTSTKIAATLFADRLLAVYRGQPRFFELYRPLAERDIEHADLFVRELLRGADA